MKSKLLLLGSGILLIFQPAVGQNLSSGLAAYWTFDTGFISTATDGVMDSAGSAHGTIAANPTVTIGDTVPGIVNQGIKFGSTSNPRPYVSIGSGNTATAPLYATDASFTISLWFNTTAVNTYQMLLSFGNDSSYVQGITFVIDGGKAVIRAKSGTSSDIRIGLTSETVSANTWYNLVAVFDSQKKIVIGYLNGVGSGTTGSTTNAAGEALANGWVTGGSGGQTNNITGASVSFGTISTELRIGSNPGATSQMQGTLDELAIWSRALSAAEVNALYQGQLAGLGIRSIPEPSASAAIAGAAAVLSVAALVPGRRRRCRTVLL
ncbi:hypothetical protein OpiT1DRAFT_02504 [Opitutaceae bacterium TAV1]|nr:hypothetical protein OpiT1DRAFT_02504 [Opitutaceae bacterium TAV1]